MPTAGVTRDTPIADELRARIARLEADAVQDRREADAPVPLGHAALDATLGGGMRRGILHEIRASEANGALAFGFAAALAARLCARLVGDPADVPRTRLDQAARGPAGGTRTGARWTLIVTTFDGAGEWGRPYGPGLCGFGLDPGRLLMVETRRPREALWAAEEGLASRALAVVLAEIRGDPAVVDLTATRRLALRAARGGVTALLVRPGAGEGLTAARTRWRVRPLAPAPVAAGPPVAGAAGTAPPVAGLPSVLPPPAWSLDLERNAARPGGRFALMWQAEERLFAAAPADPVGAGGTDHCVPETDDATLSHPQAAAAGGRAAVLTLRRTG